MAFDLILSLLQLAFLFVFIEDQELQWSFMNIC